MPKNAAAATKAKAAPAKKTAATAKVVPAKKAAPANKSAAASKRSPSTKSAAAAKSPTPTKTASKTASKAASGTAAKTASKAAPARSSSAADTKGLAKKAASRAPEGWTARELAAVRRDLEGQLTQMRTDYEQTLRAIDELQAQASDSAGDDQADAGSKTFEREHEMSLARNRADLISQLEHAVERIDEGRYGLCESCGKPIAKARLQAFPGATLCVACKQREERR